MSAKIIQFPGKTKVDIPVDDLLEKAVDWQMEKALIIGVDEDDRLCFGGSFSDVALINLLLDKAKFAMLNDEDFDGERIQE